MARVMQPALAFLSLGLGKNQADHVSPVSTRCLATDTKRICALDKSRYKQVTSIQPRSCTHVTGLNTVDEMGNPPRHRMT